MDSPVVERPWVIRFRWFPERHDPPLYGPVLVHGTYANEHHARTQLTQVKRQPKRTGDYWIEYCPAGLGHGPDLGEIDDWVVHIVGHEACIVFGSWRDATRYREHRARWERAIGHIWRANATERASLPRYAIGAAGLMPLCVLEES